MEIAPRMETIFWNGGEHTTALTAAVGREATAHLRHDLLWTPWLIVETLASKQHDYGPGNILRFGQVGIMVRICDKIERLNNLLTQPNPRNETVFDTWLDLVGYSVIAEMLADRTFTLPLAGDEE